MIQNLRQIKSRIKSIENTKKITRAMEMVAAAKLNRVKARFYAFHIYFLKLEAILKNTMADLKTCDHPLLQKRPKVKSALICIITSDTGLCSTYNHNVISTVDDFLKSYDKDDVQLIAIGKEAHGYFKRKGYSIENSYLDLGGRYSQSLSTEIFNSLTDVFLSGEVDEVYMAYTYFSSSLKHVARIEKLLNIEIESPEPRFYIFEPDSRAVLDKLIPSYLLNKISFILLSSFTSEHSERMFAMKVATDNAEDLIDTLTLLRNKVRQGVITKEVLEIAMSAEALKG